MTAGLWILDRVSSISSIFSIVVELFATPICMPWLPKKRTDVLFTETIGPGD